LSRFIGSVTYFPLTSSSAIKRNSSTRFNGTELNFGYWISRIALKANEIKDKIIESLINKEILSRTHGKLLWIFPYKTYPTVNLKPENETKARLHYEVLEAHEPDRKDMLLISLVSICRLTNEVFREKDKLKIANRRIKEIFNNLKSESNNQDPIYKFQVSVINATTSAIVAGDVTTH